MTVAGTVEKGSKEGTRSARKDTEHRQFSEGFWSIIRTILAIRDICNFFIKHN